jgi:hypothetical protein
MTVVKGMERSSEGVAVEIAKGECILGESAVWPRELIEGLHTADVGIDHTPETGVDQGNQSGKICTNEVVRSSETLMEPELPCD